MPISGRIGASFSQWQSQLGETSITSEIWKLGPPVHNSLGVFGHAAVQHLIGVGVVRSMIASKLHAPRQRPQPTQCAWSMMHLARS